MVAERMTYCFTVKDYHRMAEAGIFHEDDRVELLEGEIIAMAPRGPGHAGGVKRLLNAFLTLQAEGKAIMSVQDPIRLVEHSEPQPDLALLKPRSDFYVQGHPGPQDVLLAVEVMERSAGYDREVKVPLYARFGIPEVWLIDLEQRLIEVYRSPTLQGYQVVQRFQHGQSLSPRAFSVLELTVDAILG